MRWADATGSIDQASPRWIQIVSHGHALDVGSVEPEEGADRRRLGRESQPSEVPVAHRVVETRHAQQATRGTPATAPA